MLPAGVIRMDSIESLMMALHKYNFKLLAGRGEPAEILLNDEDNLQIQRWRHVIDTHVMFYSESALFEEIVALVASNEGLVFIVDTLAIAQEFLRYECGLEVVRIESLVAIIHSL